MIVLQIIFLVCGLAIGVGIVNLGIYYFYSRKYNKMSDEELWEYMKKNIEEAYEDVKLILTVELSADSEYRAYDFSMYEEHGIIGATFYLKENDEELNKAIKKRGYNDLSEIAGSSAIVPHANVYKMKDGSFLWKY